MAVKKLNCKSILVRLPYPIVNKLEAISKNKAISMAETIRSVLDVGVIEFLKREEANASFCSSAKSIE